VRRLVREDHLAEDLTQEVFLQVHRFRERYDPERDPRAWLFTIATNQVRSTWRSRQRRPEGREESLERLLDTERPEV
jgi:RNA polymerase sigma-70 factor (ECF subfamily)